MPTVEIHRHVDFPRGESGGSEDNNIAAAAASADADAADSCSNIALFVLQKG
jgi:hypothetical protein